MNRLLLAVGLIALLGFINSSAEEQLKVGDAVPEFKMPYATADTISFDGIGSADLKGKRYVLAFYPADWSSGCTKEICILRDENAKFLELDVEILPISTDLVFSHHEWAKYHQLEFKLLADHTREFGKKMGVYLPEYGMFARSVFVISPDGTIEYIDYEYSLKNDKDFGSLKEALAAAGK